MKECTQKNKMYGTLMKSNLHTVYTLRKYIKSLQKHIDINDGKLANFLYKYYSIKKSYDRLWKLFLKQIEEKSSSQQQENDQKLLQINFFFSLLILFQIYFSFSFIKQ
jgi:hypothetical protein